MRQEKKVYGMKQEITDNEIMNTRTDENIRDKILKDIYIYLVFAI